MVRHHSLLLFLVGGGVVAAVSECEANAVVGHCLEVGCFMGHGPAECNGTECVCKPGFCSSDNYHCEAEPSPAPTPTQSTPSASMKVCPDWVDAQNGRCSRHVHAGACYDSSDRSSTVECVTWVLLSNHTCPAHVPEKCTWNSSSSKVGSGSAHQEASQFELPQEFRLHWGTLSAIDQIKMWMKVKGKVWMKVYDSQGVEMGNICPAENPGTNGKPSLCFNFDSPLGAAPGYAPDFRWYMFLGCIIFAIPGILHLKRRESWRDVWAAGAFFAVCFSSTCCDAIFTGQGSIKDGMLGWRIQIVQNGTSSLISSDTFNAYSDVIANNQMDTYTRVYDRTTCVLAVVPAFAYFLIVERPDWKMVIPPFWFGFSAILSNLGMWVRALNPCLDDGRALGSAPMILHTLWHISLVGLFSWNCLHRPYHIEKKDSWDCIGNRYGLSNSNSPTNKKKKETQARVIAKSHETPLLASC